jgi:hypothetical protein
LSDLFFKIYEYCTNINIPRVLKYWFLGDKKGLNKNKKEFLNEAFIPSQVVIIKKLKLLKIGLVEFVLLIGKGFKHKLFLFASCHKSTFMWIYSLTKVY